MNIPVAFGDCRKFGECGGVVALTYQFVAASDVLVQLFRFCLWILRFLREHAREFRVGAFIIADALIRMHETQAEVQFLRNDAECRCKVFNCNIVTFLLDEASGIVVIGGDEVMLHPFGVRHRGVNLLKCGQCRCGISLFEIELTKQAVPLHIVRLEFHQLLIYVDCRVHLSCFPIGTPLLPECIDEIRACDVKRRHHLQSVPIGTDCGIPLLLISQRDTVIVIALRQFSLHEGIDRVHLPCL